MGKYEDLERLQKLKESGALSEQEFEKEKQKILNENNDNNDFNNSKRNEDTVKKHTERENKKTIKTFAITFIVSIMILIISVIIIPTIQKNIEKSKQVKVPNLIGKTYTEAREELAELGLQITTNYGSSDSENAIITEQNREEGYILKKGDSVGVTSLTQEQIEEKQKEEEERQKELEEAKKNGYRKSPATNETIIVCAKTLIDETLTSSSTAVWGDAEVVDQDNYGRCLVYVSLEAQNGFGGYSKLYYYVVLQYVEYDGHFTYKPYIYSHSLTTFGAVSPYDYYVSEYKSGNVYPVIKTFLDNNGWNTRPEDV